MKGLGVFTMAAALAVLPVSAAMAQQTAPPAQDSSSGGTSQPAQYSSPSSSQQGAQGQQGLQIASDSLIGSKVRDPQGKELGEVSKLMIDPGQGKIASVVISMGGTLGVGGKEVAVPWEALKVQQDQQKVVLTMDQQMLEQAPQTQREDRKRSGQQGSPSASPSTSGQEQQQPKR
jgi:sporulation protein YlmC with PRC-barrel domain